MAQPHLLLAGALMIEAGEDLLGLGVVEVVAHDPVRLGVEARHQGGPGGVGEGGEEWVDPAGPTTLLQELGEARKETWVLGVIVVPLEPEEQRVHSETQQSS